MNDSYAKTAGTQCAPRALKKQKAGSIITAPACLNSLAPFGLTSADEMDYLNAVVRPNLCRLPILSADNFAVQFDSYALVRQRQKRQKLRKADLARNFFLFSINVHSYHMNIIIFYWNESIGRLDQPGYTGRRSSTSSPPFRARAMIVARPELKRGNCMCVRASPLSSVIE